MENMHSVIKSYIPIIFMLVSESYLAVPRQTIQFYLYLIDPKSSKLYTYNGFTANNCIVYKIVLYKFKQNHVAKIHNQKVIRISVVSNKVAFNLLTLS